MFEVPFKSRINIFYYVINTEQKFVSTLEYGLLGKGCRKRSPDDGILKNMKHVSGTSAECEVNRSSSTADIAKDVVKELISLSDIMPDHSDMDARVLALHLCYSYPSLVRHPSFLSDRYIKARTLMFLHTPCVQPPR